MTTRIDIIQHNIDQLKPLATRHGLGALYALMRAELALTQARETCKHCQNVGIRNALGAFWLARGILRINNVNI